MSLLTTGQSEASWMRLWTTEHFGHMNGTVDNRALWSHEWDCWQQSTLVTWMRLLTTERSVHMNETVDNRALWSHEWDCWQLSTLVTWMRLLLTIQRFSHTNKTLRTYHFGDINETVDNRTLWSHEWDCWQHTHKGQINAILFTRPEPNPQKVCLKHPSSNRFRK